MATADLGSGPVSLFGVSKKFQSKVNSFREVIERKKLEVRTVSKEMRRLIEQKEEAIIGELNTIWEEVSARMEKNTSETQTVIGELEDRKKEIEELFQKINQTETEFPELSKAIEKAKRKIDIDIPNVKLTWRMDELEDCVNRMCRCDQQNLVYNEDTRYQLKWSKCGGGRGDNQLYNPLGIATNPMNENIYVADQWNHRVQIFSRVGEWIRSVKDDEMKNPQNILLHNQSTYVQCSKSILKLNDSTEKKEKSISYDFPLRGICTDNIHIYVGKLNGMTLIVLTLDLVEENRISLKTVFAKQDTQIGDISLFQELFYIFLFNTEFPIQAFSREGTLTRCVVKKDSINSAFCFCLDQQHNILVADYGDSKVRTFSNEGNLLTQFGEKGSKKGHFQGLVGVSVDDFGTMVTVDWNKSHILQIFSLS